MNNENSNSCYQQSLSAEETVAGVRILLGGAAYTPGVSTDELEGLRLIPGEHSPGLSERNLQKMKLIPRR